MGNVISGLVFLIIVWKFNVIVPWLGDVTGLTHQLTIHGLLPTHGIIKLPVILLCIILAPVCLCLALVLPGFIFSWLIMSIGMLIHDAGLKKNL